MFEGLQEKLEGVIHKARGYGKITEDNISEMHLVYIHHRALRIQFHLDASSNLLYLQAERLCHALNQLVAIQFNLFQGGFLFFKHRHLKDLVYLKAKSLCLVVNNSAYLLQHCRRLCQTLVLQHLRSERYGWYRSLELVRHIAYEVAFNFR